MTTDDFLELKSFNVHNGYLAPNQVETDEWLELLKHGQQVYMKHIEARDLGMHRGYFKILAFIYDRLPLSYRSRIDKKYFYKFIKMLSDEYKIIFEFKDGRQMIEYESISFAKMNQQKFRQYFNNQLTVIYEHILIPLNKEYLMDEIESEFEKLLSKLF